MARPPLDVREWLEDMRRFNSRDADRATEILTALDDAERVNGHREEMGDSAYEICVTHGLIIGDEPEPFLTAKLGQLKALSELCMAAGIIAKDDYKTDPVPMIAMFLPVD